MAMSILSPHLYAFLAFLSYALINAGVKYLGDHSPLFLTMTVRFLFGFVLMMPLTIKQGGLLEVLKTQNIKTYIGSTFFGLLAVGVGFYALPLLTLGDATALAQTYPIFLILLSYFILREKMKTYHYITSLVAFIGVVMVVQPSYQSNLVPSMLMLLCAVFSALCDLLVRKLTRTESTLAIAMWYFLLAGIVSAAVWLWQGAVVPNESRYIAVLVAIGIMGVFAKLAFTEAFRGLNASVMGHYSFLGFIMAVTIGWVIFQEKPTWPMLSGAFLILMAGYINQKIAERSAK